MNGELSEPEGVQWVRLILPVTDYINVFMRQVLISINS